jgi:hypothetical protein
MRAAGNKFAGFYLPGVCARGQCAREAAPQSRYCTRCRALRARIGIHEKAARLPRLIRLFGG